MGKTSTQMDNQSNPFKTMTNNAPARFFGAISALSFVGFIACIAYLGPNNTFSFVPAFTGVLSLLAFTVLWKSETKK